MSYWGILTYYYCNKCDYYSHFYPAYVEHSKKCIWPKDALSAVEIAVDQAFEKKDA